MDIYRQKVWWKFLLLLSAIIIGVSSLTYTHFLVRQLAREERNKMQLWAEATRELADIYSMDKDFGFLLSVIENNRTIPVILASDDTIISYRNIDSVKALQPGYLMQELKKMEKQQEPITIDLGEGSKNYIYFRNSILLTRLTYYPYIQLSVILLFIAVSYFAFNVSRKAEQNQVWVGLSKETAHQLGTPTSSLLGWLEILKLKNLDASLILELEQDISRLEKITERFSKVGSRPKLVDSDIKLLLNRVVDYLRGRSPYSVQFALHLPQEDCFGKLSPSLFEWVIENICKNAIDAISGKGNIELYLNRWNNFWVIDITDNGKGMPKKVFRTIFKPGYTTKERGWGLGLSLAKRIVENYHHGKLFVLQSEINKGTTFRIMLPEI